MDSLCLWLFDGLIGIPYLGYLVRAHAAFWAEYHEMLSPLLTLGFCS